MGFIKRYDAEQAIINYLNERDENEGHPEKKVLNPCIAKLILDDIRTFRAIEVRPKGKWVKESDYKVMGEGYMWNCSECGNRVYVDSGGVFPNYCGDCGAEMESE